MTVARAPLGTGPVVLALVLVVTSALVACAPDPSPAAALEAETMTLAARKGSVRPDSTASGGQSLLIWGNDTASGVVTGGGALTIDARAVQCDGPAQATVTVDGVRLGTVTVGSTNWSAYPVPGRLASGRHTVQVAFVNDVANASCDRNLYLDQARLGGGGGGEPQSPFAGETLYVDPASPARATADAWRSQGRTADAEQLEKIAGAARPVRYFAEWTETGNSNGVAFQVSHYIDLVKATGGLPVIGAYAIIDRDCGSFSGGGFTTADQYRAWADGYAEGIGDDKVVVILEPDAIAGMSCLNADQQAERLSLLRYAVEAIEARPDAHVYIDAGHSSWQTPATIAGRLNQAGIDRAEGFATNNANFNLTADEIAWGEQVSAGVGGKHFVVDTSRNGLGPYTGGTHDGDCPAWANPPGRALGARPTAETGHPLVDAYFWLKTPGASDADCGPFPAAGAWAPEYALGLAQRAAS
jgi:endoglucanase